MATLNKYVKRPSNQAVPNDTDYKTGAIFESEGRFSPGEASYYSMHPRTSVSEAAAHANATGANRIVYESNVTHNNILDLTDQGTRDKFCRKYGSEILDGSNYEASRELARRLKADGVDGILYPSVQDPDGTNLVVWVTGGETRTGRQSTAVDVFVGD